MFVLEEYIIEEGLWWVIPAVLFLFFGSWVTAVQTAVVTMSDARIKKLAEDGDKKARRLAKLTKEPGRFVTSVESAELFFRFAFLLCNFLAAAGRLADWMKPGVGAVWATVFSATIVLLVSCIICISVGVILPKRLGGHYCEKYALNGSGAIVFVTRLFTPVTWLCNGLGEWLAKGGGVVPGESDEQVTEEEIRMMVDVGQETGAIEDMEKSMINNVFEFDDRIAAEVMTHRTEICAVDSTDSLQEVLALAKTEGYSRMPVYRDDIDTIIGIIYVKDLLRWVGNKLPEKCSVESIMRKPCFVPESISCSELFRELTSRRLQMAIVVDEYGGTAGLVTIEDLLETIVGNMRDEYDVEDDEIVKTGSDTYEADGSLSISELEEMLDVEFPEGDYDTVGGLLLSELGRIPTGDERAEVTVANVRFTVISVENLRISKVLITKLPEPEAEQEE